jgi:hypothetical protein
MEASELSYTSLRGLATLIQRQEVSPAEATAVVDGNDRRSPASRRRTSVDTGPRRRTRDSRGRRPRPPILPIAAR